MRLDRPLATAAAALVALAAWLGVQGAPAAAATPASLVIHESFTPLPCSGTPARRTTLELEDCAEHRVLKLDRQIDALNATIYRRLTSGHGRRDFIAAHASWLGFRLSACLSASSDYSGGTLAGVVYANCLANMDGRHTGELRALEAALSPAG